MSAPVLQQWSDEGGYEGGYGETAGDGYDGYGGGYEGYERDNRSPDHRDRRARFGDSAGSQLECIRYSVAHVPYVTFVTNRYMQGARRLAAYAS